MIVRLFIILGIIIILPILNRTYIHRYRVVRVGTVYIIQQRNLLWRWKNIYTLLGNKVNLCHYLVDSNGYNTGIKVHEYYRTAEEASKTMVELVEYFKKDGEVVKEVKLWYRRKY